VTNPGFVRVSLRPVFVTVRVTVYDPVFRYVYDGFWKVEVFPTPISPKVQFQLVGDPVDVSVKDTASCAVPVIGVSERLVKSA